MLERSALGMAKWQRQRLIPFVATEVPVRIAPLNLTVSIYRRAYDLNMANFMDAVESSAEMALKTRPNLSGLSVSYAYASDPTSPHYAISSNTIRGFLIHSICNTYTCTLSEPSAVPLPDLLWSAAPT